MSGSTAIGMISASLQALLAGEMVLDPEVPVTILAPDEGDGSRCVNLFLYKIKENPALKNMDWQAMPGAPGQLTPPPLPLNLFYLLTAYNSSDPETGNTAAHEILGDAMRVFYENPVVPGAYLADGLLDAGEEIKIMLNSLDMEELSQVWATFSKGLRLSVLYEVSVVQLDMEPGKRREMAPRLRTLGPPTLNAPYRPPEIESISPISGPPGASVNIFGKHFTGWKAYARVSGRRVMSAHPLSGDRFVLTFPEDIEPGFHEIRLDISHLCRRTFFFEVTGEAG